MKRELLLSAIVALLATAGVSARKTAQTARTHKTERPQQRPEPQLGGKTPATPKLARQRYGTFDFTPGKGWVEGQVALDSGAGRSVVLFVPDLLEKAGVKPVNGYLDAEGGFRFEVDLLCPAKMFLQYGDERVVCYLYPDDTLRMTFRSADCGPDGGEDDAGVVFDPGNRSGRTSRHLVAFDKFRRATPAPAMARPTDMASLIAFLREKESVDRATLDRYAAAERLAPEVEEILRRGIGRRYAGDVRLGYIAGEGLVRPEQVRELHRQAGFPMADDRDFVDLPGHAYALYRTMMSYLYSDTSTTRTGREKLVCALDSVLTEYPPSLSRDVLCLKIYAAVADGNKTPELYARIYPQRDRYIGSPLVRGLVPDPQEVAREAERERTM